MYNPHLILAILSIKLNTQMLNPNIIFHSLVKQNLELLPIPQFSTNKNKAQTSSKIVLTEEARIWENMPLYEACCCPSPCLNSVPVFQNHWSSTALPEKNTHRDWKAQSWEQMLEERDNVASLRKTKASGDWSKTATKTLIKSKPINKD